MRIFALERHGAWHEWDFGHWTGYLACARAYTDLDLASLHASRLGARVIEVTGWRVQPERRFL